MNLTLSADYLTYSLKDSHGKTIEPNSEQLRMELAAWNYRYRVVMAKSIAERTSPEVAELIRELDELGLAHARQVAADLSAKIEYFSEGLLQRIYTPE